jgi:gamma-glutamyltranspeptidase/glutathione hydrolase
MPPVFLQLRVRTDFLLNSKWILFSLAVVFLTPLSPRAASKPHKPILHGQHWIGITGKPLAASAGAQIFARGGNAVDAACAMLAAACTMHDALSWGGETQALVYHPELKKVIGINALGVAPTGATADFFLNRGMRYPPGEGPLAAVTPGTPGGLMLMLAEYGTMSLEEVLQPAIQMAEGYPMEAGTSEWIESSKASLKAWPYSKGIFLPHLGESYEAPKPGEIFRQPDLHATLQKLVLSEKRALARGGSRKEAIMAANERFYRGDIADEFIRGSREQGGLHIAADLANWKAIIEEPVSTRYHEIEVFKLTSWVQGPCMLQILNMLEPLDLRAMGLNSSRYIHTLYQVMNLAFADRDFYYGDPYYPPAEPLDVLLSKEYAMHRLREINPFRNDPFASPGDPFGFKGGPHPFQRELDRWTRPQRRAQRSDSAAYWDQYHRDFRAGTTTIQAADKDGWIVSITPSGGWMPACIAGKTGIGMSQRMQSFVLLPEDGPYNVVEPGKRPRATLTPTIALKNGEPFLAFGVQGGDIQEQNLVQFLVNMLDFGMNVQEACEAPNITSYQMHASFGEHEFKPGKLTLQDDVPPWVRNDLEKMGYRLDFDERTSGPITAIYFDSKNGTFWGGASDHGDDYGIAW